MGTYVYKLTRAKKRSISGRDIHEAVYTYTLGGSMFDVDSKGRDRNERLHAKLCGPTIRSWDKVGGAKGTLYVWDYEDGAEVFAANGSVWYDTGDNGEHVGYLRSNGRTLRYVPLKEKSFKVTFKGTPIYDHTNAVPVRRNPDVTTYVTAINEKRAKVAAQNKIDAENKESGFYGHNYTTMGAEIVEEKPPMTEQDALTLALESLKHNRSVPLSARVEARQLLADFREKLADVKPIDSNTARNADHFWQSAQKSTVTS